MWNRFQPRPDQFQQFGNFYGQELQQQGVRFPWQAGRVPRLRPYQSLVGDAVINGCAQPHTNPQPQPQTPHPLPGNNPPPPGLSRPQQNNSSTADSKMRNRQLRYGTLSHQEQQQEDTWAREQMILSGLCLAGYGWSRNHHGKRYYCWGNVHEITDEELAQDRPPRLIVSRHSRHGGGDGGRNRTVWERPKSKKTKKSSWW